MSATRRAILFAALVTAISAYAQSPLPPVIKLVVPYPPGGSVDTVARFLQQPLQDQLKTTIVVENRPGAGGRIAASQVKREPADGSVILIAPNALTTIQTLVYAGKLDYSVTEDIKPVARLAAYPFGLAVPGSSPLKTAADVTAWMKSHPTQATYGTSGAGGMAHFSGLMFGKSTGIAWSHVAFKGGAPLITDLIGGHIPAGIDTLVDQIEHQRAGKIKVVGIFSAQRYPLAPDFPPWPSRESSCRRSRAGSVRSSLPRPPLVSWRESTRPSALCWPIRNSRQR